MYNRYIPQNDGTYQKSRVAEPHMPFSTPLHKPPPAKEPPCPSPPKEHPSSNLQSPSFLGVDVGNFLKRLLPTTLDTGDLLVIVLLLLMAGDCAEDKSTSLLTLALYLFM